MGLMVAAILYHSNTALILFGIFTAIGAIEFAKLIGIKGRLQHICAVIAALTLYLSIAMWGEQDQVIYSLIAIVPFSLFMGLNRLYFNIRTPLWLDAIWAVIGVSLPFGLLAMLCRLEHAEVVLYLFILLWTNDTFAYLTGRQFGKTKLFERLSPKKTWEGFFGGLIVTIIVAILIGKTATDELLICVHVAIIISSLGTMGDLVESSLKRSAGVKDSGRIMPGHGGILDRFDGLLLSIPFMYLCVLIYFGTIVLP